MTHSNKLSPPWLLAVLLALAPLAGLSTQACAQNLTQNNYYWYVPEHEKYSTTTFYAEPRFDTRQIRLTRTERFKLIDGTKGGWFIIEFDVAGKAYIHQRLLRSMVYNPAASDTWYEFKRASVFEEAPGRVEARLTAQSSLQAPKTTDNKSPSWRSYKDSWNVRPGRGTTPSLSENSENPGAGFQSRPAEKRPRPRHSLLPPIGSEPQPEPGTAPETPNPPAY